MEGLTPATTYHYRLVTQNSEGTTYGVDKTFTTEPAPPSAETWGEYGVSRTTALLKGEVMPDTLATSYWFDYRPVAGGSWSEGTHESLEATDESWHDVEESLSGLSSCTEYEAKLVALNVDGAAEGSAAKFRTECWPPEVRGGSAGSIGAESATLEAEVQPRGLHTTFHFEYDTKPYGEGEGAHGTSVPVSEGSAGESSSWGKVSAATGTLLVCQEYQFRVVAKNEDGTVDGSDQHFKTKCLAPTAATEAASATNTFEPQLNATVDPEGSDTQFQFEYGISESYGHSVPATAEDVGSGRTAIAVSKTLSGLERAKTYHFRVVAKNATGTSYGADKTFGTLPECKGAGEKCEWSSVASPNPAPHVEAVLNGVACVSSTNCVGVGKNSYTEAGFVEAWNGSAWSILTELNGYSGGMFGVSCGSATSCMVVGENGDDELRSWTLSYEEFLGDAAWSIESHKVGVPAEATGLKLGSVSCVSSTYCMAVGSYNHSGSKDLAETWNGHTWSVQSPPAEGNASKAMHSVSCVSSTSCITVGVLSNKPTAERWNGTEWSLLSPPSPAGAKGGALESVSCPSSSSCVAVGDFYESSGIDKTLAEAWNGSSWSVVSSPNPAEASEGSVLLSVSCLSASSCFAVGDYSHEFFEPKTLAETWNGTAWTIQTTPNPSGADSSILTSTSCVSSISCAAVGSASPGPAGERTVPQAQRWNGTEWATVSAPDPAPHFEAVLNGVACVSSTNCVGVGKNSYTEAGFVEAWNGSAWSILTELNGYSGGMFGVSCGTATSCMVVGENEYGELRSWTLSYEEFLGDAAWSIESHKVGVPAEATGLKLGSVSCVSSTYCMAVGSYNHSGSKDLVETWNGHTWSVQSPPAEGDASKAMHSVSCVSSTSCITVGVLSNKPTGERWNGTEWSLLSPPSPAGAKGGALESVSCPSSSSCVAVGDFYESSGIDKTLAEAWNGSSWSVVSSPNPAEASEGSVLLSVSCLSASSCFAVGDYSHELFTPKTLAETWNGTAWTIQTTPNPSGANSSILTSTSCTSSISCAAVGSASPGPAGETAVTQAQHYE